MPVTVRIKNIARLQNLLGIQGVAASLRMGLIIEGPAAAYALVWEWGRSDCNPGPKTLWGTNPDGQTRVLTRTAPSGYIRVNMAAYRQFIREEFAKVVWSEVHLSGFEMMLEAVLKNAALRCADLIAQTAPIDTGALRAAIRVSRVSITGTEPLDQLTARTMIRAAKPGTARKWYQNNRFLRQHVRVFNPQGVESLENFLKSRGK